MLTIQRRVVLPVVIGAWVGGLLVGFYSFRVLEWSRMRAELDIMDRVTTFPEITAYNHAWPVGLFLAGALLIYGGLLLRYKEIGAATLAWFVTGSLSIVGFWLIWTLVIVHYYQGLFAPA